MPLKIKIRLFCLNPFILQLVILAMRLEITNPLVGVGRHITGSRMFRHEHGE